MLTILTSRLKQSFQPKTEFIQLLACKCFHISAFVLWLISVCFLHLSELDKIFREPRVYQADNRNDIIL